MAFRRAEATPVAVAPKPLSMIASAVRMTLSEEAWRGYRFTDESWQKSAWDFCVGSCRQTLQNVIRRRNSA